MVFDVHKNLPWIRGEDLLMSFWAASTVAMNLGILSPSSNKRAEFTSFKKNALAQGKRSTDRLKARPLPVQANKYPPCSIYSWWLLAVNFPKEPRLPS